MEITANQLLGLPVFSLERGERIGLVKSFLLDPAEKELIALMIGSKKIIKDESVLCLADAAGLSFEVITVDSPAVLRKKADCPHLKELLKNPPSVAGLAVIKKDGAFLGRADSFYIDSETGKITKIELAASFPGFFKERSFLPIDMIEIIGSDMILAKDGAAAERAGGEKRGLPPKRPKAEPGCGERIMALSHRQFFPRRRETVFPEIPREDAKE